MRIMAVSDRVLDRLYCSSVKQRHPDVDLLVSCGDLPFYFLDFLVSAMEVPLVYVRGNHDRVPQYTREGRTLREVRGGDDIHGRVVCKKGLLLAGLEGSMRYRPNAPLMYTELEMKQQIVAMLPGLLWQRLRHGRFVDILVTHSPPYGIHDRRDLAHTGFKALRTFMTLFKPRYLLHGHVHIYRPDVTRVTQCEATTVINVYPYRVFDYDRPPET